jgi:hypothetical protein
MTDLRCNFGQTFRQKPSGRTERGASHEQEEKHAQQDLGDKWVSSKIEQLSGKKKLSFQGNLWVSPNKDTCKKNSPITQTLNNVFSTIFNT